MDPGGIAMDVLLLAIAAGAAVSDVRTGRVPNALTYSAVLAGLLLNALLRPAGLGLGLAALGLAVGFVPLFVAYLAGGLGGGDVKLMAAAGAFLGPWHAAHALLYSCLAGAVLSLALVVAREGATGIFLRIGSLWRVREGDAAWFSPLRFPFAVAVLVGCAWAVAERRLGVSVLDALSRPGR